MFFKNMDVGDSFYFLFQPYDTQSGSIIISDFNKMAKDVTLVLNRSELLEFRDNIDWLITQMIKVEKLQYDNPIEYQYMNPREEK